MKSYLIHSVGEEGWPSLVLTKNLDKDFIKKYRVTYDEEFDDDDKIGLRPHISNTHISAGYEIEIYELDVNSYRQNQILSVNTHMDRDYGEILEDFISEYYRDIVFSDHSESVIKKFNEF